jgi:hypothetical protein
MQGPATWPFTSPAVPGSVTSSGSSYVADSLGTFSVQPGDVSTLLGYGFGITGEANTRSRVVDETSDDPVAVTVPLGLVASFQLLLIQGGDGPLTISAADGVSVVNRMDQFSSAGREAVLTLIAKPGYTDFYILSGELTTIEEEIEEEE